MIERKIISKEESELYEYGLKVTLLYFFAITLALVISIILNGVPYCLLMITLFIPIRRFLGGFHFRNPYICFLCSELYILLPVILIPHLMNYKQILIHLLNWLFVILLSLTCIFKSKISLKRKYYSNAFMVKCTHKVIRFEIIYWFLGHISYYYNFTSILYIIVYIFATQIILFLLPEQLDTHHA